MAKKKILIVDDHPDNVELLVGYLSGCGYEIAVATDGRETLHRVAEFQPDLILLHVMLPKLSGFEVCERIKTEPKTQKTAVLMMTALNELGDIERAVSAGCDDFLSLPVNKLELIQRIENMLKLRDLDE